MITLEQLVVGESYAVDGQLGEFRNVKYVGDQNVFYDNNIYGECVCKISSFIERSSIIPKPKKKIKLIGYLNIDSDGTYIGFKEYDEDYTGLDMRYLKKVSEREIEVDDE